FDCGEARVKAFIPALEAGAVDGLFERLAGQHAECHWQARVELRDLHAVRDFAGHMFEMRCIAAYDATDANDGVATARCAEFFCCDRNFKRTRDAHEFDLFFRRARALQRIERASEKTFGDKAVEAADDNPKMQACGGKVALCRRGAELPGTFSTHFVRHGAIFP